jgi:hypothetical protein
MANIYWAAETNENISSEIIAKWGDYKKYLLQSGMLRILRKSYQCYYGAPDIKDVDQSLKAIHVNNYASILRNLHVMITSSRPAWSCRAINSDLESQTSAELGEGLLDYYMREQGIEVKCNKATELALFLREGWVVVDWDVNKGDVIAYDENQNPIFAGDVEVNTYSMIDVCRDIYKRDANHDWYIVRKFVNKFDLAASYKDLADKIVTISEDERNNFEYELNPVQNRLMTSESDLIPMYTLYHAKTPALPEGRLVICLDKDITLFDGPLPYKKPYLFAISTTLQQDFAFGHSNMFDLLPLQDAIDSTFSAILTNQAANAVQNFQMPKGSGIKVTQVSGGMNVIEFDPKLGPLAPLDLLKTAPEVFNFTETLNQYMQLLSGVSSISRGDAPASMSGAAMALLQQQSIQFSSGLQLSHTMMLENLGTAIIELLQTYAEEPRLAIIAGKTNQPFMKYFKSSDLQGVNRVIIDTANPLTKTSAGRVEIANQLLATPGMIKTPEQYLGVVTTGNLEPLYEYDRSRQHLTKSENEALMQGQDVIAILTDDHAVHVLEHSCVANNIEVRTKPELLQKVLDHIQDHINIAQQMTPEMAAMLKQTSFYQAPQPPPQAQAMPQGGGVNPNLIGPQTTLEQKVSGINLPKPAQSPLPNLT